MTKTTSNSRAANLLNVLADGKEHTNSELVRGGAGYRYGAVILALRQKGYDIRTIPTADQAVWKYKLIAGPGKKPKPPKGKPTLTVTITGPQASGKTKLASYIASFLRTRSLVDAVTIDGQPYNLADSATLWMPLDASVTIKTRQT